MSQSDRYERRNGYGTILGIDLGTTYSCVAWVDETGKPQIIKNKEGFLTTPSVVFFRSKTKQEVGDAAKQYAVMYPDRVVSQIKRHMGEADYSVFMDGADLRPEEISAHILRKLVQDAVTTLREEGAIPADEPERIAAVITCPAYFGAGERHATRTAGELAGLRLLAEPVNEPTAAATLFGVLQQGDTRNVLHTTWAVAPLMSPSSMWSPVSSMSSAPAAITIAAVLTGIRR